MMMLMLIVLINDHLGRAGIKLIIKEDYSYYIMVLVW